MLRSAADLQLKTTPPRVPRHLLLRDALQWNGRRLQQVPIVLVQAGPGYGKTSLLAQWRLDMLKQGTAVAWFSAQPQDDPARLAQGLAMAWRTATARPQFGKLLLDSVQPPEPMEAMTDLLAELAHSALDVALVVDELDALPAASQSLMAYLLRNLPPNLRVAMASRTDVALGIDDLLDYGQALKLDGADLRFSLTDSMALAKGHLGERVDANAVARVHELCEGWPLGLQMVLTAMAGGLDADAALPAASGDAAGTPRQRLLEWMFTRISEDDLAFLESVSVLDLLHPELCAAVSGQADAPQRLQTLARDTPLLTKAESGDWMRLHALARDRLRERLQARDPAERARLHQRAAEWLKEHEQLEAAAHQAWESGDHETALAWAERSVFEALTRRGHQTALIDWVRHLPPERLQGHHRLQLTVAWSLAISERHDDAAAWVERVLSSRDSDPTLRCECALILSGAAVFADDPDRLVALHDPWAEDPPLTDPLLLKIHANRSAYRALLNGEPAVARLRLQRAAAVSAPYLNHWSAVIQGLSFLWEGQVRQAADHLHPALEEAETQLGRRSSFACVMATLLASARWESGQGDEATVLLANRLDVIERGGLPDAVWLAYCTLARIALSAGAEHRALELLEALHAVGQARRLPRLRLIALTEQVRVHARRYRSQTCQDLVAQIDELLSSPEISNRPMWRRGMQPLVDLAHGQAAIAAQQWRQALPPLEAAAQAAQKMKLGRLHIEANGMRAFAMDRCGERAAEALLREIADLADSLGMHAVFAEGHPDLRELWRQRRLTLHTDAPARQAVEAPRAPVAPPPPPRVPATMVLTPKEREVLDLLARNLSNKEVALALQVGEETVKWHVKNLFTKLDAGNRKQVVARARILGLLPPLE